MLKAAGPIALAIKAFVALALIGAGGIFVVGAYTNWDTDASNRWLSLLNVCIIGAGAVSLLAAWRQADATQDQQRDQRFALAMQLLGSHDAVSNTPNIAARLGALYSLESLIDDKGKHYHRVVQRILSTYLVQPTMDSVGNRPDMQQCVESLLTRYERAMIGKAELKNIVFSFLDGKSRSIEITGTVNFQECDFSRQDLSKWTVGIRSAFTSCIFNGAKLPVEMHEIAFNKCHFQLKADLRNCKFRGCTFEECVFLEANLDSTQFEKCSFKEVTIEKVDLGTVSGLFQHPPAFPEGVEFSDCTFPEGFSKASGVDEPLTPP